MSECWKKQVLFNIPINRRFSVGLYIIIFKKKFYYSQCHSYFISIMASPPQPHSSKYKATTKISDPIIRRTIKLFLQQISSNPGLNAMVIHNVKHSHPLCYLLQLKSPNQSSKKMLSPQLSPREEQKRLQRKKF